MIDFRRLLVLLLAGITLSSCQAKDERYYQMNPDALKTAVVTCNNEDKPSPKCQKLYALAQQMNELAYALQINPQAFGQRILSLQQSITKQEMQQKQSKQPQGDKMTENLKQDKKKLELLLAVVRWKESPES